MPSPETPSYLLFASHIGALSDVNGDLEHFNLVSETMWKRGVGKLIAVGHLGFSPPDLEQAAQHLRDRDQTLYLREQISDVHTTRLHEGIKWFSNTIAVVPDGYRAVLRTWPSPVTLLMGTAPNQAFDTSTDAYEPTTEMEESEGLPPTQIVAGGDATFDAVMGEALISKGQKREQLLRMLPPTLRQLRPTLYLGTHPSRTIDRTATYGKDSDAFEMRTILLSPNDDAGLSQGILTMAAGEVTLIARDDATVTQLTGGERGVWAVRTQSSKYVFDFEHGTVTRNPGRGASRTINDATRRLRTIENCKVGESGYWTMKSDDPYPHLTDYYWAVSTEIRDITRESNPSN